MKLLGVKPCFMHDGTGSPITVGKVYETTHATDGEILLTNDLGDHHYFEGDLSIEGYFMDITDLDYPDFYKLFRGKCKELSEALVKEFPNDLKLVRGHVTDAHFGREQHWWTVDSWGKIHDPSKAQYPEVLGYEEFDGICVCEQCGTKVKEEDAIFMGRFPCCSSICAKLLVGL